MPIGANGRANWTLEEVAALRGKIPSDAAQLSQTVNCLKSYSKAQIESKIRVVMKEAEAAAADAGAGDDDTFVPPKVDRQQATQEDRKAEKAKKDAKKELGKERYERLAGTVQSGLYSASDVTSTRNGRLSLVDDSTTVPSLPIKVDDDDDELIVKFPTSTSYKSSMVPSSSSFDEDQFIGQFSSVNKRPCKYSIPEEHEDIRPRHLSSYASAPYSTPSYPTPSYSYQTASSWADKMRQTSPVRRRKFDNVIRLDPEVRCPWMDLYYHKDWVKIFAWPVPRTASFELEARRGEVYVIVSNWSAPSHIPIQVSDMLRSGRTSSQEFVFLFSFENIPVDLGLDPIEESGSDWHMWTFNRIDRS